jgi:hypothetical protein
MFADPLTDQLAKFVRSVGIDVRAATLAERTFLPGLDIRWGVLLVDEERLSHPGDILHEAGHIAVADPAQRKQEKLSPDGGDENAAIAWSYAAVRQLGIDPALVFHDGGYHGWSRAFIENFDMGRYVGVPLLQAYDMAVEPPTKRRPTPEGVTPFPHMLRWVR